MATSPANPQENLIALITGHQAALQSFILALLPDRALAADVLQETNLVLWRKAGQYDASLPFMPWACQIARFQVKACLRDLARDRHVFNSDLLNLLAAEGEPDASRTASLDHALRECLAELPAAKRELILSRYREDASVETMASGMNLKPGALSTQLHRIRRILENCIQLKLTGRAT